MTKKNKHRKNPVPPSKQESEIRQGALLKKRFSGHDVEEIIPVDKPKIPDTLVVIGHIDGILYSAIRDDVLEKYIHEFKKKARPLFCVSPDGKLIVLLGGAYDFTERGIVDRT